jgi:hypothetical protein
VGRAEDQEAVRLVELSVEDDDAQQPVVLNEVGG